jgi:hypothetical protein
MNGSVKNKDYILYLDMDGVLVDFEGGFKRKSNGMNLKQFAQAHSDQAARAQYLEAGMEFWTGLDWIQGGKELWDTATRLYSRVCILSSSGTTDEVKSEVVEMGKRAWLKKNIPSLTPERIFVVRGKHRKQEFAAKNSILVDDIAATIKQWNEAGGFGILHNSSNYKRTLEDLEDVAGPIKISEIVKRLKN